MLRLSGSLLSLAWCGLAGYGLAGSSAPAQSAASPVAADQANAPVASNGAEATSVGTSSLGPCSVTNLRANQPDTIPLLIAACGKAGVVVGEATSFMTAYNAAQSSLLIVRQRGFKTYVSVVVVGSDNTTRLDNLTPGLEKSLARAGRIRSPLVDVDLTNFAATGTIIVTPRLSPALQIEAGALLPATAAINIDLTPTLVPAATRVTAE